MKYISEDNRRHSPVSMLVDEIYGKNNTVYSCGNGNLASCIDEIKGTGEEIIVYVDLVPGNIKTSIIFRKLLKSYKDNKNVYIVPILSTEACIVESLRLLNVELDTTMINILDARVGYPNTKYRSERNLDKVTKNFYVDIELLAYDLSYYKEESISINEKLVSKEERGVQFILAHKCYIPNGVIEKYSESIEISLCEYIGMYVEYYNRLANVNDFPEFPSGFNYSKYVEGK